MNIFRTRTQREIAAIQDAAASWVIRQDRGLTAAEQDELSAWLAADARHREALSVERFSWEELDRITGLQNSLALPNPDLVQGYRERPWYARRQVLALASVLVLGGVVFSVLVSRTREPIATTLATPCERRTLQDGSLLECNRGSQIAIAYDDDARRVRLVRGEANFVVAKDPQRPFYVTAGDVTFRAVGTSFNVRLDAHSVEIVVREGLVEIGESRAATASITVPLLKANDRAVIPHTPAAPPMISSLSPRQLEARLAWQPRLFDFNDELLSDIVSAFNRHNTLQVRVKDTELERLRLSATIRSDNVEGFLRLLASQFGVEAKWRNEREVDLKKTN